MSSPLRAQNEAQAERAVLREAWKVNPDLDDRACEIIIAEAKNTLAWQSAMACNEPLHLSDLVSELRRTHLGAVLLTPRNDPPKPQPKADHAKVLASMTDPYERITYARANGLT